jgi:hypothetical protein
MDTLNNSNKPDLFSRYTPQKRQKFQRWLLTPHGREVYGLFRTFAQKWRAAGHDRCGSDLIINRLRWEVGLKAKYQGYKISNDYSPMLARQLVHDDPSFDGFFVFHDCPAPSRIGS